MHHVLGLAIFLIVMAQVVLGLVSHYVFRPAAQIDDDENDAEKHHTSYWQRLSTAGRFFRSVHIFVGVVTAGLLYWITWNGINTEWNSMAVNQSQTPDSVKIVYWIVVAVPIAVYMTHAATRTLRHTESVKMVN